MQLYKINELLTRCVKVGDNEFVDVETGEALDTEALDSLKMEFKEKMEGLCKWQRNLTAEVKSLKEEKAYIDKRKKSTENLLEHITNYIDHLAEGKPGEYGTMRVKYRKSEGVVIDDISKIPKEFLKYDEPKPDLTGIKKALKSGEVEGAHIEERSNISIG